MNHRRLRNQQTRITDLAPAPNEDQVEKLRAAMFAGVTALDITKIIQNQTEKAVKGDRAAARFVLDVLGLTQPKSPQQVIMVQQNNQSSEPDPEPVQRIKDEVRREPAMELPPPVREPIRYEYVEPEPIRIRTPAPIPTIPRVDLDRLLMPTRFLTGTPERRKLEMDREEAGINPHIIGDAP